MRRPCVGDCIVNITRNGDTLQLVWDVIDVAKAIKAIVYIDIIHGEYCLPALDRHIDADITDISSAIRSHLRDVICFNNADT